MASQNHQHFAKAVTAWRQQDYDVVFTLLEHAADTESLHLRGLAARRLGRLNTAKSCLERASSLAPRNPEIHHNLALLDIDRGEHHRALASTKRALRLQPDWHAALRTQARIFRALGDWSDAALVYDNILRENDNDALARYGRAVAWLEQGQAHAAAREFDRLIEAGMTDPSARFMRGRAHQALGHMNRARADLGQAMQLQPCALFLREAARQLWMMNEHDAFLRLVSASYSDENLQLCASELLRQSDHHELIPSALAGSSSPDALAVLAWSAIDQGQFSEALAFAERAIQASVNHAHARAAIITSLCRLGQSSKAQAHVDHMRGLEPNGQHWIAYQLTVWRLLGDSRYNDWLDYDKLIQIYELEAPAGYTSIKAFNAEFETALLELHNLRCHPLDQSLRGGSQTRRDLQLEKHAVIQAYLAALNKPIQTYLEHIGQNPDHPLSQRNTGKYELAGCWSVKLNGGGHHVNHVHPEGWISSAYYVKVPPTDADSKSGWIKFGEPAYPTEPASGPEHWVQPRAGRLVLFPSYLWHGTNPTNGDELRLTAPFDIIPA